jgi:lipoate-protein ligase A
MSAAWCDLGALTPQQSVALDASLLRRRGLEEVPDLLALYSRDRPCISLGHFSREEELDMGLVRERDIALVRRISGGRAIYSDPGQMNYALALGADKLPENPGLAFAVVCGGLISGLARLGLRAAHHAPNDIEIGGRKVSGSALKRGHGAVLVHGTMLIDTDLELMSRLFRASEGRAQRDRSLLTDLRSEMGRTPARTEVTAALAAGLGEALEIEFAQDLLVLHVEQRQLP